MKDNYILRCLSQIEKIESTMFYFIIPHPQIGETALMLAAKGGHVKIVQEFIRAGANVNYWVSSCNPQ